MESEEAGNPLRSRAYKLLQKRPADRAQNDLEIISEFLQSTQGCLSLLDPTSARILARHLGYEYWEPGHVGVREGRVATSMYIAIEGHCQVYNLPEGAAGELLEASAVPAYEVFLRNTENKPSFRQAAKAVIAGLPRRQASTEQYMSIGEQSGWVEQGEPFCERALLDVTRRASCSVTAGPRGVHLLSLDRIAYSHMKSQTQSSAETVDALAALHGAMCIRPLKDPPDMRSEEDIELLTDLMVAMQAFRNLPRELCLTLAEGMVHVRAPEGATIIEEGDPGDCMYLLLSKSVEVRQRPDPEGIDLDAEYGDNQSLISGVTKTTKHGRGSVLGGSMIGGQRSSIWGGGSVADGRRSSTMDESHHQSSKRKHFESAVSKKDMIISLDDEEADKAGMVKHDGNYWINKFLQGVQKAIPRMESQSGHDQESMTPLAAVTAAKWKWMTFNEREEVKRKQEAIEWEKRVAKEAELKEAGAMHDVLGMGAAKAVNRWRQQALAARKADEDAMALMQEGPKPAKRISDNGGFAGPAESDEPAIASASEAGGQLTQEDHQQADKVHKDGEHPNDLNLGPVPKDVMARQRWGTAGIAVNFAVRAKASIDPNKRMLNRMAKDQAKLSEFMMGEMSRRADVEDLLQTVSKAVMRKGAPRRMSVNNSKRLYEAIKATINRGASDRGFAACGGDNRSLRSLSQGSNFSGDFETMTRASSVASLGDHPDLEDLADDEGLQMDDLLPSSPSPMKKSHLTRDILETAREVELVGVGPDGKPVKRLLDEDDETYFGPLVRALKPGSTFGELSLLQKSANRTASILVPAPAAPVEEAEERKQSQKDANDPADTANETEEAKESSKNQAELGSPFAGVELIRVTRECYDHTVNHLMVKQLHELLQFLGEVEPFKDLPGQHLSSLAVFMRPVNAQKGSVIVREGDVAENLYIIREGDVRVMAQYAEGVSDIETMGAAPKWHVNNRTITHVNALHNPATPAQMRALGRSKSDKTMERRPAFLRSLSGNRSAVVGRWGGSGGINGAGIVVHGGAEVSGISKLAPLAVLGAGQTFGEELLGKKQFSENEEFETQYYGSTVVATTLTVKLLEISSRDLRRFGRKVVDAVTHYSRLRAKWHSERLSSCLSATVAAAQAIENLQLASPAELHQTPQQAAHTAVPLESASTIMARRRSDTMLPGIRTTVTSRRWSADLPPQLSLRIPPPPEGGTKFPPIFVGHLRDMRPDDYMRPPSRDMRRILSEPLPGSYNRRHSLPEDQFPEAYNLHQEGLNAIYEASGDGWNSSGLSSRTSSAGSAHRARPAGLAEKQPRPKVNRSRNSSFGSNSSSGSTQGGRTSSHHHRGKLSHGRPSPPPNAGPDHLASAGLPPTADKNFSISGTGAMPARRISIEP